MKEVNVPENYLINCLYGFSPFLLLLLSNGEFGAK